MTTTINSQIACLVEENLNLQNPQRYKFRNAFLNPTDNVLLENIANTLNTRTPERYQSKTPKQYQEEAEKMRLDIIRKESEEGGAAQTDEMGDITKDQDKVKSDATKAKNLKDAKFKERVARRKDRLKEEKKVVVPVKEPEEEKEEEKGQSVPLKTKFTTQNEYHNKKTQDKVKSFKKNELLNNQVHTDLKTLSFRKEGPKDLKKILDTETPKIKRDNQDVKNLEDVDDLLIKLNADIDTAKKGHIDRLKVINAKSNSGNTAKPVIHKDSYNSAKVYHEKIAGLMKTARKELKETQSDSGSAAGGGGGGGGGGGLRKKGGSKN
jgi:hypothetical protein